jgi:general secretion pathway protein F
MTTIPLAFMEISGLSPVENIAVVYLAWMLGVAVMLGLLLLFYRLFSLPLRHSERSSIFLDVLETSLKHGQNLEQSLIGLSRLRDFSMGPKFHVLTAHLEAGKRLDQALDAVPGFLPAQLVAILKVGFKLGDVSKVLPAGRRLMSDAISRTQGAEGYLLLLQSFLLPVLPLILGLLMLTVLPKFKAIASDMGVNQDGWFLAVFDHGGFLLVLASILTLLMWFLVFCYLTGLRGWRGFGDGLAIRIPWIWKRLQRDFSSLLAILLDAGLPEPEAVLLAASATGSRSLDQRAHKAVQELRQGATLVRSIHHFDRQGELQWHLTNAVHAKGQFRRALEGWHEVLDAQAYRLEQATSHALTTALVLLNGGMVGVVVAAVFGLLLSFMNEGLLW